MADDEIDVRPRERRPKISERRQQPDALGPVSRRVGRKEDCLPGEGARDVGPGANLDDHGRGAGAARPMPASAKTKITAAGSATRAPRETEESIRVP